MLTLTLLADAACQPTSSSWGRDPGPGRVLVTPGRALMGFADCMSSERALRRNVVTS